MNVHRAAQLVDFLLDGKVLGWVEAEMGEGVLIPLAFLRTALKVGYLNLVPKAHSLRIDGGRWAGCCAGCGTHGVCLSTSMGSYGAQVVGPAFKSQMVRL